jgi:hypothetical protein
MRARLVVSLLALLAATGCASSVYEGKYAWDDGWRKAEVVRVGQASEFGGRHFSDCRFKLERGEFSPSDRFVVVSFAYMSRQRRGVLPLAANAPEPIPGEKIYANVRRCDRTSLEPRVDASRG